MMRSGKLYSTFVLVGVLSLLPGLADALNWQDLGNRASLSNAKLTAKVQGGFLYELVESTANFKLVNNNPAFLTSVLPVFGSTQLNLAQADVTLTSSTLTNLTYHLTWAGGISWEIDWSIEGSELVLRTSAVPGSTAQMFSFLIEGCDIASYQLVMVEHNGIAETFNSVWNGSFGDPNKLQMPQSAVQPLVALFEGVNSGWIVEGRDLNIGPSVIRGFGQGTKAEIMFSRGYMHQPTSAPEMYEIRFRTYSGNWPNAVNPYIDWMENELGFVPLDQKPETWVNDIRNQAYSVATDFAALADLTTKVTPAKTYLGRQAEYRFFGFDVGYPDYDPTPQAVSWLQQANSDGFHVGVHVNVGSIDRSNTALVQQFEPGFFQTGTDGGGSPIYDGTATLVYCSAAYAPWRAHLVQAISNVVAAGASVIYLDQTNGLLGKFFVNGVTGIEGVQLLMQEIKAAYPGVVIQTEQFNPMSSRHACFALTTLDLGHPLSGHIFSRFIKIVPEGSFYEPTQVDLLDQFMGWGHFVPGASRESTWLEIANAFADYNLSPATAQPLGSNQLSAFTGPGGVVAFFQTTATTRSLQVFEPGQPMQEFGLRHENITTYSGPGAVEDWLIYNGSTLLGLNPGTSYFMDPAVTLGPNRFHITSVPPSFLPYLNSVRRIIPQEIGTDDEYFRLYFTGSGTMTAFVEDDYNVYLDGVEIVVDRNTDTASIPASAPVGNPSELIVHQRSQQLISGLWANIPWTRPLHKSTLLSETDSIYPNSFFAQVAGAGLFNGKFPASTSIRATGEWGMRDSSIWSDPDASIKVNGIEVLRLGAGSGPPFSLFPFDVDLTQFADQHVFIEFVVDGEVLGPDVTDWKQPSFDVITENLDPIGGPNFGNGWSSAGGISVRASSAHGMRSWVQSIDGSGMDAATGLLHTHLNVNSTMSLSGNNPGPVTRVGTAVGSHWVEYTLDDTYDLDEIWIWNYNELHNTAFGMKEVKIEVSTSGGFTAGDWTLVYDGQIPSASANGNGDSLRDLSLPLGGISARLVVITTDYGVEKNHSNGVFPEVGLSEIRFFGTPTPLVPAQDLIVSIAPSMVDPNDMILTWPSELGRTYTVDLSTNGAEFYIQIITGLPATTPTNMYIFDSTNWDHLIFRVRASPAP